MDYNHFTSNDFALDEKFQQWVLNPDEAHEAVNEVRQRPNVSMPLLTVEETNTKEEMFAAIVHGRRVELAFGI